MVLYTQQNSQTHNELPDDPHRPRYHYLPLANWMNDPNGLIQWRGEYHMFYQYNPSGPFFGTMHWGHAVSKDLVHWQHLPMALSSTPGGPDTDGCWSGCAIEHQGVPMLFYTGVWPETQCLATGSEDMVNWQKYAGNPIIAAPPDDLAITDFRDPRVWRDGDAWYMTIGAGIEDVGGAVLLYRSTDLFNWDYLHPLHIGDKYQTDPIWTEAVWECPDFFPLGDKHVLLISTAPNWRASLYFVGDYRDHKFTSETLQFLDFGDKQFFAPQTFLDEQGRRLMFGWLWEGRSEAAFRAAGWAGVMSLPKVLTLRQDGLLGVEAAPELQMLRGQHTRLAGEKLTPSTTDVLSEVQGDCLEIIAEFDFDGLEPADYAHVFGLKVRCSPEGDEETVIGYNRDTKRLYIQRKKSSLDPEADRHAKGGHFALEPGQSLRLHIFLDRSVVELFANGWACLTARIYPSRPDSLGLAPYVDGGSVVLKSMDIWEVRSIWA